MKSDLEKSVHFRLFAEAFFILVSIKSTQQVPRSIFSP